MPNRHEDRPVYSAGVLLNQAKAAAILLHGRGASAQDILRLSDTLKSRDSVAYFAPQAAEYVWYPNRFTAPIASNEPALTSALNKITSIIDHINAGGIPTEKIVLLGFSQGACLALEYAARNPRRYGGVIAFSGGLIGETGIPLTYPDGTDLQQTPVFIGCSDVDMHITLHRVEESATALEKMNAHVTKRIYPGMGHIINEDEVAFAREHISTLV